MTDFEGKKSSNDIIVNETVSADEVVASDVPPKVLFLFLSVATVDLRGFTIKAQR